jgi:hypothetical protein
MMMELLRLEHLLDLVIFWSERLFRTILLNNYLSLSYYELFLSKGVKDNSYRMSDGEYGRVIETVTFNRRTKLTYKFEKFTSSLLKLEKFKLVIRLLADMVIKELFHVFYSSGYAIFT